MIESFLAGFTWTARVLLCITGGVTALTAALFILGILAIGTGAVFNMATEYLARKWEASGKTPRHKLGRIIMGRGRSREGS